ncbi:hypothetical protein VKT23_019299 [Stygiomarasmius scandens]|uniref:Uncharacterized protein n=1 Tax=Marasmiellus scandens TaxID=2682957 RepID=A0ABR1ILP9_9AGAR
MSQPEVTRAWRRWCTQEQLDFLLSHVEGYRRARNDRAVLCTFKTQVYTEWFRLFENDRASMSKEGCDVIRMRISKWFFNYCYRHG